MAINIASAIWDVRKAHERTEQRAQRDFSNVTGILADQTASALEAVDLILRDAARSGSALEVTAALPRLRTELAHVPQVAALLVLDSDGTVLGRSEADAFDPAHFTLFREAGAEGRYISDPYPNERGRWRVLGASVVVVYDARKAGLSSRGRTLGAEHIRMSVLPAGSRYDPASGRATLP